MIQAWELGIEAEGATASSLTLLVGRVESIRFRSVAQQKTTGKGDAMEFTAA